MFMSVTVVMLAGELTDVKRHHTVHFSSVRFLLGQYLHLLPLKKKSVISRPG